MAKRRRMSRGASRRNFTRHGTKTHRRNLPPRKMPMRGGIRM